MARNNDRDFRSGFGTSSQAHIITVVKFTDPR
jgi:hypothetical protein